MKLGWLLFGIGLVIAAAGFFLWQIGADSPGWDLATVFKVLGIVFIALGGVTGLMGVMRIAVRKRS